ncbi:hypothetical protein PPYR_10101 [Photinus pyralis]|uniref:Uncharacterized protein n=1 Tax=Photinus pyralis TaxID=7054 RepID=A0A5N4AFC9_PHOPY|nr:heat shock 70 kDa protein-like [Photinus pyralis]XP_031347134.1 heat shock 70 kDa protein-like [Photinus pyralis]KAB0796035.1 hypothetical protein PPYR_10096 [Photinus pyralis]KAB0796040.1 hypothetical protein PPYR_10101 [Photinus pyralis]
MSVSPAIGIDLGTTRCCVGYLANNKYDVDIIENQHGDRTTPSYVAFTDNGEVVGKQAKDKVYRNPENVVYDSKRLIGRLFDDPYIQQNLKAWTFNINAGPDSKPLIQVIQGDSIVSYSPHQISAKLLAHMKSVVENRIGEKITRAVVTVPAYFNYHQRIATREAGKLAGLETCIIMNEPTAAVLAYVHKHHVNDCKNVLVFDLGGGTFDVSIVSINGKDITVKATSGNTFLGGRDFDNNLAEYIMKKLNELNQVDVSQISTSVRRINARCENIKTELSFEESTQLDLHNILMNGTEVDLEITRSEFEAINDHLFKLCIQTVENCLRQASLFKADVEKILLVGGSTRIPKLRSMLSAYFGDQDKLCHGINPDEAVAYGAAILAAGGEIQSVHNIKEITPLSLGIDVVGNRMSFIIHRNTPIPVTKTRSYITVSDEQTEMEINVYEGERSLVQYNTKIGTCIIELPPKPPGYQVEVTFHIDVNGILEVGASTDGGVYTNLSMEYEKVAEQKSSDMLKDALENKQSDERKRDVISCLIKLKEYCIKMKALCTYKPHMFTDEEKHAIIGASEAVTAWVNDTVIEDGTDEEKNAIVYKKMEIEGVCEPILQNYGFNVGDMGISKFHKFLIDHDAIFL